jgi:hypothetical protein
MSIASKYWIATFRAAKVVGSRVLVAVGTTAVIAVCEGNRILVALAAGVSEGAWGVIVAGDMQAARSDDNA